jgi:hypothetical protein
VHAEGELLRRNDMLQAKLGGGIGACSSGDVSFGRYSVQQKHHFVPNALLHFRS